MHIYIYIYIYIYIQYVGEGVRGFLKWLGFFLYLGAKLGRPRAELDPDAGLYCRRRAVRTPSWVVRVPSWTVCAPSWTPRRLFDLQVRVQQPFQRPPGPSKSSSRAGGSLIFMCLQCWLSTRTFGSTWIVSGASWAQLGASWAQLGRQVGPSAR